MSETQTIFIGGSFSAAAVAAVAWFVRTLIERQLKQMDDAFARVQFQIVGVEEDVTERLGALEKQLREYDSKIPEIHAELEILKDRVRRFEQRCDMEHQPNHWANEDTKPDGGKRGR